MVFIFNTQKLEFHCTPPERDLFRAIFWKQKVAVPSVSQPALMFGIFEKNITFAVWILKPAGDEKDIPTFQQEKKEQAWFPDQDFLRQRA